jgi:hypothetical protein
MSAVYEKIYIQVYTGPEFCDHLIVTKTIFILQIRIHSALPYGMMGAIAFQAAVLGLFLPETRGKATLETMDDIKGPKDQGVALLVKNDDKIEKNEKMESKL